MSLLTLPTEIVYRILDHLSIYSTLISLRRVCKRLHTITDTYDRYELDLSSIPESKIKLIASIIRPENIISLILTQNTSRKTIFDLFFLHFKIHEFPQLRSLTLSGVTANDLNRILQALATCRLSSLSIHICEKWNHEIGSFAKSLVTRFDLRKLILKYSKELIGNISWPYNCNLNYLSLEKCTYSQYQLILGNLPYLKTLIIRDCIIRDHNEMIVTFYSHLSSLTINDCHLSVNDIEFLLAQTPSLVYLKLGSRREVFDSIFDGSSWEKFIIANISSLKKFEFLFSYTLKNNNAMPNINSHIDSFRTPFWLNEKRWFVICDYNMQQKIINLYTTPICISKTDYLSQSLVYSFSHFVTIRWAVLPMNTSHLPILSWTDGLFDINDIEIHNKIKLRSIPIDGNRTKYLSDAMQTNTIITQLDLRHNHVGVLGAEYLAVGLRYNKTLQQLNLALNQLGDEGAQQIANLLQNSTVL
ncbi:unnamed protein product [Rotaria magnacalcarata]|uniref:F-box domain-containing protein n=1 Tax=Rotaria magnacalcarata TaxID=392030 RepID=A0A816WV30_9BILA|nr:unnamed protein product [Rotaria magnacalcarata]